MNCLGFKAYIVNLRQSADRRKHMQHQLEKSGIKYEFIDAVDAGNLTKNDIDVVNKNRKYFQ